MKRLIFIILPIILSQVLAGCRPKENMDNYEDKFSILINRYLQIQKIRYSENKTWANIIGSYRIGLDPDDNLKPRVGRFLIEMNGYEDPLCPIGQTCKCTGIFSGTYAADEYKAPSKDLNPNAPYDPLSPYNEDPDTGINDPDIIGFKIDFKIEERALNEECPDFIDYSVIINVYKTMKAVIGESNKEYYTVIPELK